MFKRLALVTVATIALVVPAAAGADVVTDWNRIMVGALETAGPAPPLASRDAAIVQASVFDAVNGIARRYTPVHVPPAAPRGASRAAAAAGAAHESLVALFPLQRATLDQQLSATLARIGTRDDSRSIMAGLRWGEQVADQILTWRATDGLAVTPPPYVAAGVPGRYAPTPPAFAPPAFRQFATMTPFAIASPAQFLPAPPPPLTSAQYARDFNEVKALGSADSAIRTPEQTETALFWQSDTPAAIWNRIADDVAEQHGAPLQREARILALMNISLADATIAFFNAKNYYDTWRPITAIQQADTDGNPGTTPDSTWTPLLVTPSFQEYPSGHAVVSNGAASVLAAFYGDDTSFTATSATMTTVQRSFTSFSQAVTQVENARVWGGIHFRTATIAGAHMGGEVADYVIGTHLLPIHGHGGHHGDD
ncbi:MAG: vanadium-dependent haloperoxidase [Solirubrobacteraceae bacterium]